MKSWWKQLISTLRKETTETTNLAEPEPGTEELTLPPSAGALWEKIRDATAAQLNTRGDRAEERRRYEIGGGSILAARWQHRESYDIDLTTTDPNGAIAETVATNGGLASAIHGIVSPQSSMHRAVITTHEGTLDVTKMRPKRDGEQRTAIVNGRPETVLTTAQIIEGKLARAPEVIARDVYDVMTAREMDPTSLEKACGNLAPREAEAIATLWDTQNKRLEADGEEKIRTLNGEIPDNLKGLGRHGAQAIKEFWLRSHKEGRTGPENPGAGATPARPRIHPRPPRGGRESRGR